MGNFSVTLKRDGEAGSDTGLFEVDVGGHDSRKLGKDSGQRYRDLR